MSSPVDAPAAGSCTPLDIVAATVRLSQQMYDLPDAAAKAAFVVQHVTAAVGATAAAVVVRLAAGWSAHYSPAPPDAAEAAAPPHDSAWLEVACTAAAHGEVPADLAAALGATPEQCALLPLRAGNRDFGLLALAFAGGIPDGVERAAPLLARQLADACAQEWQAETRRAQELEGLRGISGLARAGGPPAEFYATLAEHIARLLRADSCVISQWDEAAETFRPLGGFGRVEQATPIGGALHAETNRLTAQVFTVQPILIHTSAPGPAVRRLAQIIEERLGFRTALGVRLVADGRTVGALVVLRRSPDALFDDNDSRLLEIIATPTAQELRNFQTARDQQAHVKVLEGLWDLAQLGRNAASTQAFHQELAAQAARLLDSDACFLLRYDAGAQVLRPAGAFGVGQKQQPTAAAFPAGPGAAFEAALSDQAVQVDAQTSDPRLRGIAAGNRRLGFELALGIGLHAGGKPVGALAVLRRDPARRYSAEEVRLLEIIARPMAQEIESYHLRRTLQRFLEIRDAILKHLPDAIVVYDQRDRIIYANPVAQQISAGIIAEGKTLDEVKAGFAAYGISGGPVEGDTWLLEKTLREGRTILHEQFPVSRPGHRTRHIDFTSVPIRDGQGAIQGAALMYRDITSQVETERLNEQLLVELEDSEGRLRSLVNHIESAVMVRDKERILYVNEKYCELFGITQNVVGMTVQELTDLIAPCFADSDAYRLRLIPASDQMQVSYRMELEIISPQPRFVERISSPISGGNGEVFGRIVEYRDLTQPRRLVAQRDEFLVRTAYVLRSALGLQSGGLQRLLRQLDALGEAPETGRATRERIDGIAAGLREVAGEIASVVETIGKLRDLSRALEGWLDVTPQPHDLAATVTAALRETPELAATRVARAGLDQGAVRVLGHPERVQQIVRWLLENAYRYSRPGLPVEVQLVRGADGRAHLHITDHGIGLGPDEAAQVFSCYYRSQRAVDRWPRGLGISLYLARVIVERLGGALRAHSPGPDCGATFVLELPLAP